MSVPTAVQNVGRLHLTRRSRWKDRRRSYLVVLDGRVIGRVRDDETKSWLVRVGRHRLELRSGSNPVAHTAFSIDGDGDVELVCFATPASVVLERHQTSANDPHVRLLPERLPAREVATRLRLHVPDPDWRDVASCRGEPADLFGLGDEVHRDTEAARAICGPCPARWDCLREAVLRGEMYGIWGGLDVDERDWVRHHLGVLANDVVLHGQHQFTLS